MKKKATQKKNVAPAPKTKKVKEKVSEKTSALDAAAEVLKQTGKPMRCQEMIAEMGIQDLWKSLRGKTPHATLYSAILREIENCRDKSRFKKVDRGQFAFIPSVR